MVSTRAHPVDFLWSRLIMLTPLFALGLVNPMRYQRRTHPGHRPDRRGPVGLLRPRQRPLAARSVRVAARHPRLPPLAPLRWGCSATAITPRSSPGSTASSARTTCRTSGRPVGSRADRPEPTRPAVRDADPVAPAGRRRRPAATGSPASARGGRRHRSKFAVDAEIDRVGRVRPALVASDRGLSALIGIRSRRNADRGRQPPIAGSGRTAPPSRAGASCRAISARAANPRPR